MSERRFVLPTRILESHMWIMGGSGTGKTTFLKNLIYQVRNSRFKNEVAFIIIDPHGDFSEEVLRQDPDPSSIYYIDFAHTNIAINPLELPKYSDENERDLLVEHKISELMKILENLFGVTLKKAPRLSWILQMSLRYLYSITDALTFRDLYTLILRLRETRSPESLRELLQIEEEGELVQTLETIQKLPVEAFAAVLNRLQLFATSKYLMKTIGSVRKTTIPILDMLMPGKLTVFRIGVEIPANLKPLMASIVAMSVFFGVMERARLNMPRTPVILVVDEFPYLQSLGLLKVILSEARKFGLFLWMAHQNTQQLSDELVESLYHNTMVQVVFRLSGPDARRIASLLDPEKTKEYMYEIATRPNYSALIRLAPIGTRPPSVFFIAMDPPPPLIHSRELLDEKIREMNERYGVEKVDEAIIGSESLESRYKYVRYLPKKLPHPVSYVILSHIWLLGESYPKEVARRSGMQYDTVRKVVRELMDSGFLELGLSTKSGRLKEVYRLTPKSENILKLELQNVAPSDEGREIAEAAVRELRAKNMYVAIPTQTDEYRPDLIAIPSSADYKKNGCIMRRFQWR